jgi:hypothetical protein
VRSQYYGKKLPLAREECRLVTSYNELSSLEACSGLFSADAVLATVMLVFRAHAHNSRDYKIKIKMAPRTNIMSHIGNDILMDFD